MVINTDELAAMAMQGLLATDGGAIRYKDHLLAVRAYDLAEAMQAESRKREERKPMKNTVDTAE